MDILRLLWSGAVPFLVGYALSTLLVGTARGDRLLRVGLAYGLGLGVLTYWMLLLDTVVGAFGSVQIAAPLLLVALAMLAIAQYLRSPREANAQPVFSGSTAHRVRHALLLAGITGAMLYIFWRALTVPVEACDAIVMTAFKGKVFHLDRGLARLASLPHAGYPPLMPLAQAWTALCLGGWHESYVKLPAPLMLTGFLFVQYAFLRGRVNVSWSLLGDLLLLSAGFLVLHATIAYRDLTLACYNAAAILLLLAWYERRRAGLLVCAGLLSAFGCFTKLDGLLYTAIHGILFLYVLTRIEWPAVRWRSVIGRALLFGAAAGALPFAYFVYKAAFGIPPFKEGAAVEITASCLERLPLIGWSIIRDLFLRGNWNVLWFLLAISLGRLPIRWRRVDLQVLTGAIVLSGVLVVALLLLTPYYLWISDPRSATSLLSRMILHVFPLVPALIVLLNASPGRSCMALGGASQ